MPIDVLIPHYCDVDGLVRSLETVASQTCDERLRVIIVDDGSDRMVFESLLRAVASHPGEVVVERNDQNRGRPFTRNRLVELARAPYLAWLDSGDLWYQDKLKLQMERYAELASLGVDCSSTWITCDYDWRWSGQQARLVEQDVDGDQLRELFLGKKLRGYLWSILAPTESFKQIGPFDEQLPRMQDLDVFIRFVAGGGRLEKPRLPSPRALCLYEKSDVGRNAAQIRACNDRLFDKYAPLYRNYGRGFVRQAQVNADLLSVRFAKNNGDRGLAAYYLGRALLRDPIRAGRQVVRRLAKLKG